MTRLFPFHILKTPEIIAANIMTPIGWLDDWSKVFNKLRADKLQHQRDLELACYRILKRQMDGVAYRFDLWEIIAWSECCSELPSYIRPAWDDFAERVRKEYHTLVLERSTITK